MEKMSPQPQRSPSIVPLARDQDGNPIELPEGAVGWRVRRQTGGRPRLMLDASKQPLLLPLEYTIADVEDVVAPGNYLLDVVDKTGAPLGVTIGLALGMLRNAESVEPDNENEAETAVPMTLPNTSSEVRLVLEAQVRATQMAFIHNQRTLELGLRMAETLRDGVQVLANAQADWIKSISSARGFFRNPAQPLAPVEVKQLTVTTGGDDTDDDGGDEGESDADGSAGDDDGGGDGGGGASPAKPHWAEQFMPIISQVMMQVMPAINAWSTKQMMDARERGAKAASSKPAEPTDTDADEQRAAQLEHEHATKLTTAIAEASSPGPAINLMKLFQLLPQRTATRVMEIQGALSADEQAEALQILQGYSATALEDLLTTLDAASFEQGVGFMRRLIAEQRRMQAARRARGKKSPPDGSGASGASGPADPGGLGGPVGPSSPVGASGPGHPSGSLRPASALPPHGAVQTRGPVGPSGAVAPSAPPVPSGPVSLGSVLVPGGAVHPSAPPVPSGAVSLGSVLVPGGRVHPSGSVVPGGAAQPSRPAAPSDTAGPTGSSGKGSKEPR